MKMKNVYITVTGTRHYYGTDFMKKGMRLKLVKDKENEIDGEAIAVETDGLGKVGYVANSPHTVLGESMSAGRLYDKIGKSAAADIVYITPQGVVCRVRKSSFTGGLK